jgi:sulfate adenylyltransferase
VESVNVQPLDSSVTDTAPLDIAGMDRLSTRFESSTPAEILEWAAARFAPRVTFATGFGVEGCVLIHLIADRRLPIDIFTLDTGLLFPETRDLWRRLEQRYGILIRGVHPLLTVARQAEVHGDRLWERQPDDCCGMRKVEPLTAELAGYDAWITAIRRDQTTDRAGARIVEHDARFGLTKVNPLVNWTTQDIWRFVLAHDVPYNPLHDHGFPSIGCVPCTSPVEPGEDPRAGRWRGRGKRECGLHDRGTLTLTDHSLLTTHDSRGAHVSDLVQPHGGTLVDRIAPLDQREALAARTARAQAVVLDGREIADLELIAVGAASPLTGFLGEADYRSVLEQLRLVDGTLWPLPFTLAIDAHVSPFAGDELALHDADGHAWGVIRVTDIFSRDPMEEARAVYGTDDPAHPGVAYLLARPRRLVGGPVDVLPLGAHRTFGSHRLTPRELRARIAALGWKRVAGFQTRNPIHRAHEHLTKLALEVTDGLVIHPLVGETKQDDVPAAVRFQAYEALIERYYPRDRTLLAAFPAAMRYAGPREALFHAIARKNYGITHLIVGRDHAGVGSYYGPYDAQQIFDRFDAADVGVVPLRLEPTFYCRACETLASSRTCPHGPESKLELSGSRVREILKSGGDLPHEFTRPEVAEILRAHYRNADAEANATAPQNQEAPALRTQEAQGPQSQAAAVADAKAAPVPDQQAPIPGLTTKRDGFIVWFTGLSGAGKSTLAQALEKRLAATRRVEVLDGDEVRTHLSKGLGFSKEDRDTNIRRIGFVARLLARHGVVAVGAAISPYAEARDEVRAAAARDGVAFVEVHVHATLDALVNRDVKGLYRKALAGEIDHFTGVSDPYEPPLHPDVVVRSDRETVDESLARVVAELASRGLITGGEAAGAPSPSTNAGITAGVA